MRCGTHLLVRQAHCPQLIWHDGQHGRRSSKVVALQQQPVCQPLSGLQLMLAGPSGFFGLSVTTLTNSSSGSICQQPQQCS